MIEVHTWAVASGQLRPLTAAPAGTSYYVPAICQSVRYRIPRSTSQLPMRPRP
jgi:hypothetical protein